MSDETPEEMLARFEELASRTVEARDRAIFVASSGPTPEARAFALQMVPIYEKYVADWDRTFERLRRDIQEGTAWRRARIFAV